MASRIRGALTRVGLRARDGRLAHELSLGEQQRLAIARAIVHKPQLVIADEPTGNLDPILAETIFDMFLRFKQFGVAVLIATHDRHLIQQFPNRTLVLQEGRLLDAAAY